MTALREMQKVADLYAQGRASVHQIARVSAARDPRLLAEIDRLSKLLDASNERNRILHARVGGLLSHVHQLTAAIERRKLMCAEVPSAEKVHAAVEKVTGVEAGTLFSKSRLGQLSRARWLGWLATRHLCPELSLTEMGRIFVRDHSSILHALRCGSERLKADPEFAADFHAIVEELADASESEAAR